MALLQNQEHEERPWGSFDRFTLNESSTVKLLTLKAGMRLSLQRHAKRTEFWRIVSGTGTVRINDTEQAAMAGDEFHIPPHTLHRLSADSGGVMWLEIAFGEFDEHDEERVEDDFGRAA